MSIYFISQNVNFDYDTYDSAVVYAESEEQAKLIHPANYQGEDWHLNPSNYKYNWCSPEFVNVELLSYSEGDIPGVILASFNAG